MPDDRNASPMTEGSAPVGGSTGIEAPRRRGWIPLWILQVAELGVAVALVDISLHVDNGGLLVAAAVAFVLLAITAKGPLGLVRITGPRLHVSLVEVTCIVVALAPVLSRFRPDIEGIIAVEFVAVGMIRLATLTSTAPAGHRGASRGTIIEARAVSAQSVPTPTRSAATAATATSTGGDPGVATAPGVAGTATAKAARWAGRATGAGKRTVEAYRPEAEERVKKTIRSAGRVAGRATASPRPAADPGPPEG